MCILNCAYVLLLCTSHFYFSSAPHIVTQTSCHLLIHPYCLYIYSTPVYKCTCVILFRVLTCIPWSKFTHVLLAISALCYICSHVYSLLQNSEWIVGYDLILDCTLDVNYKNLLVRLHEYEYENQIWYDTDIWKCKI